jgi:hypothetical protein
MVLQVAGVLLIHNVIHQGVQEVQTPVEEVVVDLIIMSTIMEVLVDLAW